jgi:hypothetical protein
MNGFILYLTDDIINTDNTNIREQITDIIEDPDNFGTISFSNHNNMIENISKTLNGSKGVTVCNLWESRDVIYAGYYVDVVDLMNMTETDEKKKEDLRKKIKLNLFGSQISGNNVASAMVIIKKSLTYEISNNNVKTNAIPVSIESVDELINIFESVIVKDGAIVKTDGSMQTYKYIANPLEHFMLTVPNHADIYRYHEYEIYTHVIIIIVDTTVEPTKENLNRKGTQLSGKPTYGDIFIGMYKKPEYTVNPPYIGLPIPLLNKILNIRSRSIDLTINKTNSNHEYINFEKLLDIEIKKYKNMSIIDADMISGDMLNLK